MPSTRQRCGPPLGIHPPRCGGDGEARRDFGAGGSRSSAVGSRLPAGLLPRRRREAGGERAGALGPGGAGEGVGRCCPHPRGEQRAGIKASLRGRGHGTARDQTRPDQTPPGLRGEGWGRAGGERGRLGRPCPAPLTPRPQSAAPSLNRATRSAIQGRRHPPREGRELSPGVWLGLCSPRRSEVRDLLRGELRDFLGSRTPR